MISLFVRDELKRRDINSSLLSPDELQTLYEKIIKEYDQQEIDFSIYKKVFEETQQIFSTFWLEDNLTECVINKADENIKACNFFSKTKNFLILAGAGMSVDSSLKTFETMKNDVTYEFDAFDKAVPHKGYEWLRSISDTFDTFILTTNVDNLFIRAGFSPELVYECHGNYANKVCEKCFTKYNYKDKKQNEICCGEKVVPNFVKIGTTFSEKKIDLKEGEERLKKWLSNKCEFTIIEIGCGLRIPTLRDYSEILLKKYEKSNLIRVNPSYCSISEEFRKKTALLSCGIIEAIEILNKI